MNPIYKISELSTLKSTKLLPLICKICETIFYREVKEIRKVIKGHPRIKLKYCNLKCYDEAKKNKVLVKCGYCESEFYRWLSQIRKSKSGKSFCSQSCSAIYNNINKTHGTRRSKFEIWIGKHLSNLYPNIEIYYNNRTLIDSELDVCIPNLKLAFEFNGIFHYKPIYGESKFNNIQKNDKLKIKNCLKKGIELNIINISEIKRFTVKEGEKYFKNISKIIDNKLLGIKQDLNLHPPESQSGALSY